MLHHDELGPGDPVVTAATLDGHERFSGGPPQASVLDFWRFAMGDLRTNNLRGYLAEFLVAQAVGSQLARIEWDPWDVTAPDGTRIEVKTSGFVQAWPQTAPSSPGFTVKPAAVWDAATGGRTASRTFNADVYVFCLHTARVPADYDVLDIDQWRFYVCDREGLVAQLGPAGGRLGLTALVGLAGEAVTYSELATAIAGRSPLG